MGNANEMLLDRLSPHPLGGVDVIISITGEFTLSYPTHVGSLVPRGGSNPAGASILEEPDQQPCRADIPRVEGGDKLETSRVVALNVAPPRACSRYYREVLEQLKQGLLVSSPGLRHVDTNFLFGKIPPPLSHQVSMHGQGSATSRERPPCRSGFNPHLP